MRKGMLVGGIVGFLIGLAFQSRSSLTGMAASSLSQSEFHLITMAVGLTIFIAALCGIICAFIGALLEEVFEHNRLRR